MRNRLLLLVAALAGGVLGCGGDDDGPPMFTGPEATADMVIPCTSPVGDIEVPVTLTATLETDPVSGTPVGVQVVGELELTTTIVDLIYAANGNMPATVSLTGLGVDMDITGATPGTIDLTKAALPESVDFDMGVAVTLATDVAEGTITPDASGSIDIVLSGATVNMEDVPILGTMDLVVPTTDPAALVSCQLPDPVPPIHFDVP